MNNTLHCAKNLLFASIVLALCGTFCFAQNKVDLEVTAQTASETARGGENFSYTVTVKNVGAAKATDVILMQDGNLGETSALPGAGTCALLKESQQLPKPFRCLLGDIEQGESVIINFSVKIRDFGGEEETYRAPFALFRIEPTGEDKAAMLKSTVADINVDAQQIEENKENNRTTIRAELLPSKNKPPRVELISPKNNIVIIKPLNKTLEIPLRIKASDPDGKIAKVRVGEQNFQIIIEDNQYKFIFGGKKYTAQEAEDAQEELAQYYGGDAVRNNDGTYSYIWKNFHYGKNSVHIEATDDGGRFGLTRLEIEVKSDGTVKIVSPETPVFSPGSIVTFETTSVFSDGIVPKLRIIGTTEFIPNTFDELPLLRQISKTGNIYKHQLSWKVPKEGDFDFTIIAFENDQNTNILNQGRIIGAYPRVVKISAIKNGQIFDSQKPIEIKIEARDSRGTIVGDRFQLLIDEKEYAEMNNSLCENCEPRSYIWNPPYLTKGSHTIQAVGKNQLGIELGRSEIISIDIK